MVASGICHTDILLRDGRIDPALPVVPGHEGAGVVEAAGEAVLNIGIGDHVALTQASCGVCVDCLNAHPMNCCEYHRFNRSGRRANGMTGYEESINGNFVGHERPNSWRMLAI